MQCDADTMKEIQGVVKGMDSYNPPGPDDISVTAYKIPVLKHIQLSFPS
jgi:hypothetical protein